MVGPAEQYPTSWTKECVETILPPFDLVPRFMDGASITLQVTAGAAVVAFILSVIAGLARLSTVWLIRTLASVYVEVIRGTSVLVQLFWIYFALPLFGVQLDALAAGILAIGLNYGAYGSEVVRGSILAIDEGQTEASIALNMTPLQRMRIVILPQALLRMLPAFGNLLVELIKGTALVSLITLTDLTFVGHQLNTTTFRTMEIFLALLVFYFCIGYPLTLLVRWLERKLAVGRS